MKILAVHNSYQQPGGEDVVFEQECRLLRRFGHEVFSYRRTNWELAASSLLGRGALLHKVIWNSATRREIAGLLAEFKPDVVHVHNTFVMISPAVFSACHEANVPVVNTLHNYRLLCPAATFFREGTVCEECVTRGLWRSVLHGCYHDSRPATAALAMMLAVHRQLNTWHDLVDYFIALTHFSRQKFVDGGIPQHKLLVKPNFVDPDPGERSGDGEYAIFVGRLSPEKRVTTLLSAWGALHIPIPLWVVGGGPQRNDLEADARSRQLSDIRFLGQIGREAAVRLIRGARFLIFSSEWYENFPVTIAEAFACGVPVIAAKLGAMAEIVEHGRTGLHFAPGDAADLTAKVNWAWNHCRELREIGRQARSEYMEKYTPERNYGLLMDIYNRAISGRA